MRFSNFLIILQNVINAADWANKVYEYWKMLSYQTQKVFGGTKVSSCIFWEISIWEKNRSRLTGSKSYSKLIVEPANKLYSPIYPCTPPSESSENGFANTVEVRNTLSPNRRMRHHFPSTFFNHAKYVIIDFLSNLWAWTSNCGYVISCNGIILLHCIIPSTTTF